MNAEKRGFARGVVYACAQLIRNFEEGHAEDIWNESGFDEEDLKICSEYDAKEIRKHLKGWRHDTN